MVGPFRGGRSVHGGVGSIAAFRLWAARGFARGIGETRPSPISLECAVEGCTLVSAIAV